MSVDLNHIRIVILICVFARGGAERQAYLLARQLRQRHGLDVEVWALSFDGDYREEFASAGVPTRVLHFGQARSIVQWMGLLPSVVRHFRVAEIDVLLPLTTWPNVVAGLTYRLSGIRLCIWGERHAGGERVPGFERIAVKQYRQFVANSTAGVEFLAGEMRVERNLIAMIGNGVEEPLIAADVDWRAKLGLQPQQPLVAKVANLTNLKDHATLLRAWKIVQESWSIGDRPVLALAGIHGDRYDDCRRIVGEAGLASTVRFLGSIPDVSSLVQASDFAVFSSRNEGMPNGVLECMAAGKAVVASDLPGVRDALGPNAADVVVAPGDVSAFAARLLDMLRNKDRCKALGEVNRRRIRAEFSVERMVDRHLQVIMTSFPHPLNSVCRSKKWKRTK